MSTLTPYLDCVVLAAAVYPSGFGYSLFTAWRGEPRGVSTGLLAALVLPLVAVRFAVWRLRPELLTWHTPSWMMLALAFLLGPLGLGLEYLLHACATWRRSGKFARRISTQSFWGQRLTFLDHALLVAIAVGEEIFFRAIWIGVLLAMGTPASVALVVSSLIYGLNHMAFGPLTVLSKAVSGALYGVIYLLGGGSILLPIVAHVTQNSLLFWRTGAARD